MSLIGISLSLFDVMKKVLFVIDSLTCGGAEKSLVSLLPLLNPKKYDLFLWMRHHGGEFVSLLPSDIKIVSSPSYSFFERVKCFVGRIVYSLTIRIHSLWRKKEHLAETLYKSQGWAMKVPEGEWDVAIAYQQGLPTYLVAEKIPARKKIAWINVNVFAVGYNTSFNRDFYKKFDSIVSVSDSLTDILKSRMPEFSDKYITVYDVLNPGLIRNLSCEPVQKLKSSDGELVFVTTGRLVSLKGYDIAVEAAGYLKTQGVKFKWYFIGEGNERHNIEQLIIKRNVSHEVCLLGLKTNPYPYMKQADIYVQTSRFEGFGLTIGEAKILGRPVVSTNFDVVKNQITDGKNGLIAEMNGKSVADTIMRLVGNDRLREAIVSELNKENNLTSITEVKKVEALLD